MHKYIHPQTEAQEYGWMHKPLVTTYARFVCIVLYITLRADSQVQHSREDRRLNFPRQNSEITKYMDAAWRLKEQTENLQ